MLWIQVEYFEFFASLHNLIVVILTFFTFGLDA